MEGTPYFNQAREGEERRGAGRTVGDRPGRVSVCWPEYRENGKEEMSPGRSGAGQPQAGLRSQLEPVPVNDWFGL